MPPAKHTCEMLGTHQEANNQKKCLPLEGLALPGGRRGMSGINWVFLYRSWMMEDSKVNRTAGVGWDGVGQFSISGKPEGE